VASGESHAGHLVEYLPDAPRCPWCAPSPRGPSGGRLTRPRDRRMPKAAPTKIIHARGGGPPSGCQSPNGRCGVGLPLRALRHLGHCPAPPRSGPRWPRATVGDRFLGCGRMRFLPPLVHQDVEGYEEVFEVHAQSTAFRSGSCRGGNGERAGSGPATPTSSWMAPLRVVLAGGVCRPRSSGRGPARFDRAHRAGAPRPDAGTSCP
jgi:hypothetical protein